ncbi:class I SAM-dependent methyltransferase [Frankia sp. AiPs1]|uniref:class I SAM-dependent methyltransferase n=1 Tax=Frankia sp. AiPs1 TaxID=573493 RepID=UPI002044C04E|nr:class I SAM-dependent methyltransferase [Frankia sp. AiPs1]MCM3921817.1 class I SAM-dependent methyltransferase [Frankia sp. AiPs1]
MPTLPSGSARSADQELHRQRVMAESFGADPERYDRTRPRYPQAMVARIVTASPGPDLLDVGCGTGIAARQFRAAGCRVLGVDVDERMVQQARYGGVEVEVAAFEAWDPVGRTFDAVAAGQSWHWVDPVGGASKAAQVLRPGGRLAVFWNAGQPPPGLAAAFSAVYRRVLPDASLLHRALPGPDGYSTLLAGAADGIRRSGAFGDPQQWRFDREQSYTRDEWLDQVPTFGGHSTLPPASLARLLAGLGAAVDALGGAFSMRYTTVVITAARTDRPVAVRRVQSS